MNERRWSLLRQLWKAQAEKPSFWIHPAALEKPGYADVRQALDSMVFQYRLVERKARYLPNRGYQVYYYRVSPEGRRALEIHS